MIKKDIIIGNVPDGDVSVAALLVQRAGKFSSSVYIEKGTKRINAKSIMGVMTLQLEKDETFTIAAEGDDEEEAAAAMEAFFA